MEQKAGISINGHVLGDIVRSGDLVTRTMAAAPGDWDKVLDKANYVPVSYTRSMVCYQAEYAKPTVEDFYDMSSVLYSDDTPVGVWPLNLRCGNGVWGCFTNEGPVRPPLFIDGLAEKTRKALINGCLTVLESLCRHVNQSSWNGVESFRRQGMSNWHRKIMEKGASVKLTHEIFVDLSLSLNEIKAAIRKSYKPLISKGQKLWKVEVYDAIRDDVFTQFRIFHRQVAGRVTRSMETWALQEQAINNKEGFLVVLRDSSGGMVGGGLFHMSRSEGLYFVGVYERTLFDLPLGHVVQMKAIEYMKQRGLQWYKVGERFYPGTFEGITEKQLNIARFQEGFATHMYVQLHTSCPVSAV